MTETKQHNSKIRKIIRIDEELCTGCGNCVVECAEGALKVIDGKARVVNEIFCDGLGACISGCPEGALEIIEREALEFDEEAVEEHLESIKTLETQQIKQIVAEHSHQCGCPSAQTMVFDEPESQSEVVAGKIPSALRQWPVQMHLINPRAPYYQSADVLLAADCTGFSYGDFHRDFLNKKSIAIACPKLDQGREVYIEKIRSLIDDAKINTLTVAIMEVPCCGGLLALAQEGAKNATRKVPIKYIVVSVKGEILKEEWV
ncbi:MAG: 4Fe-4S ferredoxin [Candidatus Lokiarchaeota archaeon]|nr:4Fe-4S ferredoxin [Candidatus Lokiarchaeota archaeon]